MSDPQTGQLTSQGELRSLVEDNFPLEEVVYAFGYGSGVLSQHLRHPRSSPGRESKPSDNSSRNLIDIILAVRDSHRFHRENLRRNPQHYVSPRFAADPAAHITWWQRHAVHNAVFANPRVYFNVTDGLKYGVVQVDDLVRDLQDWDYLYLAGRLQKPTVAILNRADEFGNDFDIERYQQQYNLPAALSAALLLHLSRQGIADPATFVVSPTQVYMQLAAISYTGDFRTAIGAEDPEKVQKLVSAPGQLERFHSLYGPTVGDLQQQGVLEASSSASVSSAIDTWHLDASPAARELLWCRLPARFRHRPDLAVALARTVAPAARYQSLKGLATAGVLRSAAYALRKLSKGVLRFAK